MGVLYMHTHQNAGVDLPGFGVGAPGPSNADRGNAAIATKAGIAYFIFEPNRILEIKSDGSQVAYDRWRKP